MDRDAGGLVLATCHPSHGNDNRQARVPAPKNRGKTMVTFTAAPNHAVDFNTSFTHLSEFTSAGGLWMMSAVSAATSAGFTGTSVDGPS